MSTFQSKREVLITFAAALAQRDLPPPPMSAPRPPAGFSSFSETRSIPRRKMTTNAFSE